MKALVVGSGGREHALGWRLSHEGVDVVVAPGNGGTSPAIDVPATDVDGLLALARTERVDLTIVGPEGPLALGLVDTFEAAGQAVFGPRRGAARLEWSKAWAKDFLFRHGIATARAETIADEAGARRVISRWGLPLVLKADGLAAGKGVFVVHTTAQVETALHQLFRTQVFRDTARHVVVEECLDGPEVSVLAFTDGERLALMPPARDYKRLGDGDTGPNTGGMGGLTWPTYVTAELLQTVERDVLRPTLAGMLAEGEPYRGVLYAGLMLTADGPRVLEFNCRFGDPECQLLMPLLEGNVFEACASVAAGRLDADTLRWRTGRTYGVVLAAPGYPEAPRVGSPIDGLESAGDGVQVFHAGTARTSAGEVVTAGGRVLTVVGVDRAAVYDAADAITFDGKQLRRDIGREEAATAHQRRSLRGGGPTPTEEARTLGGEAPAAASVTVRPRAAVSAEEAS